MRHLGIRGELMRLSSDNTRVVTEAGLAREINVDLVEDAVIYGDELFEQDDRWQ